MQVAERQTILAPGDMLGCYRVERFLGQGGFGVTYLARDTLLDMQVAIKEYLPEKIAERFSDSTVQPRCKNDVDVFTRGLASFMKEARTLARFRHPNIVRVLRVFEQNGTAYMVMEYECGHDLKLLFSRNEQMSEKALRKIIGPIIDGLEEVHRHGFIHRDIKPANILVRENGTPVLLDFGAARLAIRQDSEMLTTMVTAGFAPLEQYSTHEGQQGPWTDIYALGAVLYFAVTGQAPLDSTLRGTAVLNDMPDPLVPLTHCAGREYSRAFCEAVDWALHFKVSARPQSVMQWRWKLINEASNDATEDLSRRDRRPRVTSADKPGTRAIARLSSGVARAVSAPADFRRRQKARNSRDSTVAVQHRTTFPDTVPVPEGFADRILEQALSMGNSLRHESPRHRRRQRSVSKPLWTVIGVLLAAIAMVIIVDGLRTETERPAPAAQITSSDQAAAQDAIALPQAPESTAGGQDATNDAVSPTETTPLTADESGVSDYSAQTPESTASIPAESTASISPDSTVLTSPDFTASASASSEIEGVALQSEQSVDTATQALAGSKVDLIVTDQAAKLEHERQVQRAEALRNLEKIRQQQRGVATETRRDAARRDTGQNLSEPQPPIISFAETDIQSASDDAMVPPTVANTTTSSNALKPPVTSADMNIVLARFNALSHAIKDQDLETVLDITVDSQRKRAYFAYAFKSFEKIQARIGNIRVNRQDQTIRATLYVGPMTRSNGDVTDPPEEFGTIAVSSVKDSEWSRIYW